MTASSRFIARAPAALALLAAAVVFLPGIAGPFVLDDHVNLAPVWRWLQGGQDFFATMLGNRSGPGGRPLAYLTLMANAALDADSTFGFKLVNVLIHVANTYLVFLLAQRILTQGAREHALPWVAAVVAALWAVHPMQTSTVLYVVQRMAMLGAAAQLGAVLLYVEARTREDAAGARGLLMLWFPLVVAGGVLAKESALIAPLLCAALELSVFARMPRPQRIHVFFACFLLLPALAAMAWLAMDRAPLTTGYAGREFTLYERVLTEPGIVLEYAARWFWPAGLALYRDGHAVVPTLAGALPALFGCMALVALALGLRRRAVLASLGLLWFFAGHVLEAGPFPLELYFEHRNYLPSLGLSFIVVEVALRLRRGGVLLVAATAVAAAFALARSAHWADTTRLLAAESPPRGELSRRLEIDRAIHAVQVGDAAAREAALAAIETGDANDRAAAAAWRAIFACDLERAVTAPALAALRDEPPHVLTHNHVSWLAILANRASGRKCEGLSADALDAVAARWEAAAKRPLARDTESRMAAIRRQLQAAR